MPLTGRFEDPAARFGDNHLLTEQSAQRALENEGILVLVVVKVQRGSQCVGGCRMVHDGKASSTVGTLDLPVYAQTPEVEEIAFIRWNRFYRCDILLP